MAKDAVLFCDDSKTGKEFVYAVWYLIEAATKQWKEGVIFEENGKINLKKYKMAL